MIMRQEEIHQFICKQIWLKKLDKTTLIIRIYPLSLLNVIVKLKTRTQSLCVKSATLTDFTTRGEDHALKYTIAIRSNLMLKASSYQHKS